MQACRNLAMWNKYNYSCTNIPVTTKPTQKQTHSHSRMSIDRKSTQRNLSRRYMLTTPYFTQLPNLDCTFAWAWAWAWAVNLLWDIESMEFQGLYEA